ncbi:hypothetical protein D7223_24575 [Micromonospora endolithica]|uniref:Alpha/beta fold hydrolase n=1 Tax=Micromonospora endolithica TaxID=230091 RepID=A0A3A9YZY6_9ACTN|nr:hypothetical protein D7223_24575 [Micromonospora endolithica]
MAAVTGTAVVFVHGFLSSPAVWSRFADLLRADEDLPDVEPYPFGYESPLVRVHPLRRAPTIDVVADSLRTYLAHDLADSARLVLVSHSQGGLVIQRALARMLAENSDELARIRLVVMYACPNAGSDLGLPVRRLLLGGNPQEAELRPFHTAVLDAQRVVLHRLVAVPDPPVRLLVYAGESDRVVTPVSARSVWPEAGVVPGDHSTVIQPDSPRHRSYVVLRHALLALRAADGAGAPAGPGRPPPPAPADGSGELVDLLLAVPGMYDPAFRQQVYAMLPPAVQAQLPRNPVVRVELIGLTRVLVAYRHLGAGRALGAAVTALVPEHPALDNLLDRLAALDVPPGG